MRFFATLAIAAASIAMPAQAATLYSNPLLTGPVASPGSVGFGAASPIAQSGFLSFNLNGFNTIDGTNSFQDDFTLSLNSATLLSISYDLGGGGMNAIFANPNGATITGGTFGINAGGQLQISLPVALLSGVNAFTFSYTSPGAANNGGQPISDEAWGVSDVLLTAQAGPVPESATWMMMIVGFGAAGSALRYRRRKTTVTYA